MSTQESAAGGWSGRKRRTIKLGVVLASVVVGLLMAEVFLRVAGYSYPVFYAPDERRGWSLRPGMAGWYRKENDVYVRINNAGLRDREHSRQKPAATLRIAVIGDSYAEALQVPLEDAFWMVLERRLKACGGLDGRDVEVINFGVSGYGTAQELITLREQVWDYAPDIVVLAVTTNNDITDNSRALKKTDEIPYFVYHNGAITLDDSFRRTRAFRLRQSLPNRLGSWIRDSSRVIQAIHQSHGAIKTFLAARRRAPADPAPPLMTPPPPSSPMPQASASPADVTTRAAAQSPAAPPAAAALEELGTDNLVYAAPRDAVWNDAWRVTEALITLMRDEVAQQGAKFVVVTLSNGIQVHPDPAARQSFMRRVSATDIFYPDRRLKLLGEREGFSVINLAPELQVYAQQNKVFLHGFGRDTGNGHWNQAGHHAAGELLAPKLCAALSK